MQIIAFTGIRASALFSFDRTLSKFSQQFGRGVRKICEMSVLIKNGGIL